MTPHCRLTLAFAVLSTAGCSEWSAVEEAAAVVWADDDSELAVAVAYYEARERWLDGLQTRATRHQLFIRGVEDGALTAVTTERSGLPREIFFMKSAGYFLLGTTHGESERFETIDLDGTVKFVAEMNAYDCGMKSFSVLPSPDGQHLAVVHHVDCDGRLDGEPSGTVSEQAHTVQVRFLDAETLAPAPLTTVSFEGPDAASAWRVDGMLVLSDGRKAWQLRPNEPPQSTQPLGCLEPRTTSSPWSSDGRYVSISDGTVVLSPRLQPDRAFGACQ